MRLKQSIEPAENPVPPTEPCRRRRTRNEILTRCQSGNPLAPQSLETSDKRVMQEHDTRKLKQQVEQLYVEVAITYVVEDQRLFTSRQGEQHLCTWFFDLESTCFGGWDKRGYSIRHHYYIEILADRSD
jgi:hypothetical protein